MTLRGDVTMNIKRTAAVLLLLMLCVCTFSGCAYKVRNEDKALHVYTCSFDNVFSLEKVVVFEDRVVTVFSKKNAINIRELDYAQVPSSVHLTNLYSSKSNVDKDNFIKEEFGKLVVTTLFEYDEADKIDPDKDIEIVGVTILGREITFNDGNFRLSYYELGGECEVDYWQDYDKTNDSWSEVESKLTLYPLETWAE